MDIERALLRFGRERTAISRGQRGHARARLRIAARLVTIDGTVPCTLVDASCTGAKLFAAKSPGIGSMIVVERLPIELFGVVRWVRDGHIGMGFDEPLSVEDVVALRRYAEGENARNRDMVISHVRNFVNGTG